MNNDTVFKIVRETPKYLFYKVVLPAKVKYVSYFNDFNSSDIVSFKKYTLEDSSIIGNEYKVLKTRFDPSKVIEESDLCSYFYVSNNKYLINQDTKEKHLFFKDDNYKLLEIAFKLKGFVLFFSSPSTLQTIGEDDKFYNIGNQEK